MRPSGSSAPGAGDDRDLAALQQRLEARGEPVDDGLLAGLRRREVERRAPRSSTPNSAAARTVRSTSAVWSSSLAGMQPRCRQVPPTRCSSTMRDVHARAARRRARRRSRRDRHRGRRGRSRQARATPLVATPQLIGSRGHLEGERHQDHQAGERRENDVRPGAHCNVGALESVRMRNFRTHRGYPRPRVAVCPRARCGE